LLGGQLAPATPRFSHSAGSGRRGKSRRLGGAESGKTVAARVLQASPVRFERSGGLGSRGSALDCGETLFGRRTGFFIRLAPGRVIATGATGSALNPVQHSLVFLVHVYRWTLSPAKAVLFGPLGRCRFSPSCSAYMVEAVRLHGALAGTWLGLKRICRCQPRGGCGWDPVPPKREPDRSRAEQPASCRCHL